MVIPGFNSACLKVKKLSKEFHTRGCSRDGIGAGGFEAFQVDDRCQGPIKWNADLDLLSVVVGNRQSVGRFGRKGLHSGLFSEGDVLGIWAVRIAD